MHVRSFSLGGRNLRQVILSAVLLAACVFFASSAISASSAATAEPPPLQMGVLPYLSSERLFQ